MNPRDPQRRDTAVLAAPVEELWSDRWGRQVSTRTVNCLRRNGIDTVGQLCGRTAFDLLEFRAFGYGCLNEVYRVLDEHGLGLRGGEVSA